METVHGPVHGQPIVQVLPSPLMWGKGQSMLSTINFWQDSLPEIALLQSDKADEKLVAAN